MCTSTIVFSKVLKTIKYKDSLSKLCIFCENLHIMIETPLFINTPVLLSTPGTFRIKLNGGLLYILWLFVKDPNES